MLITKTIHTIVHVLVVLSAVIVLAFSVRAQGLDPGFLGTVQGKGFVYSSLVQTDGKIVVTGRFVYVNNLNRKSVVRINADGSLDNSFDSGAGVTTSTINGPTVGSVYTSALQTDGKVLIGGGFDNYNGTARNRIARLNADGSIDSSFNPGTGASAIVWTVVVQADGKILIGGDFSTVNGTARGRIARLNADGTLDMNFNPSGVGANSTVKSIALQSDGKILIGGGFTTYNTTGRISLARLNSDGTLDTTFVPAPIANSSGGPFVGNVTIQSDGKILIGGTFTSVNSTARNRIARIDSAGSLDNTFDPGTGANATVNTLRLQSDGKILVGGGFGTYNGTSQNGLARINSNGTLDLSFSSGSGFFPAPDVNGLTGVSCLAIQADGKVLAGGSFAGFNGVARVGLIRLSSAAGVDSGFNVNTFLNEGVEKIVLQPDGRVIIGGGFVGYNGVVRSGIARVNVDGSLDASFDPGAGLDNTVKAIAIQTDGKILIGGFFTIFNGQTRNHVARLNSNGSLDSGFNVGTGADAIVRDIIQQTDGKVLIGGDFTNYNGTTRNYVARVNLDGTLDTGFTPASEPLLSGSLNQFLIQPDGKILMGGYLFPTGSMIVKPVVRLNTNGSLDGSFSFTTEVTASVAQQIVLQTDGKVVASGGFAGTNFLRLNTDGSNDPTFTAPTVNGNPTSVVLEPGGSILIGGPFTTVNGTSRNHIARLLSNGELDILSFNSGTLADSFVNSIVSRAGAIYLAGYFTAYNGTTRIGVARLGGGAIFTGRTPFDFDGDGRADFSVFRPTEGNWYLNQSSLGFRAVRFGLSTDKLAPADYDGDGRADIAIWRENVSGNSAYFWILNSATNTVRLEQFGLTGDILTVNDWDGDGKDDLAVYRGGTPSYFYYRGSMNNPNGSVTYIQWGTTGDKPMRGDFDGDGKADAAVFRSSNNFWYMVRSSDGQPRYEGWGVGTDKFVPADYDGDGKTDLAVYRNGTWYIRQSGNGAARYEQFGLSTDVPVPADYDGDGRADISVFRGNGLWYSMRSSNNQLSVFQFGLSTDRTVESSYIP